MMFQKGSPDYTNSLNELFNDCEEGGRYAKFCIYGLGLRSKMHPLTWKKIETNFIDNEHLLARRRLCTS